MPNDDAKGGRVLPFIPTITLELDARELLVDEGAEPPRACPVEPVEGEGDE